MNFSKVLLKQKGHNLFEVSCYGSFNDLLLFFFFSILKAQAFFVACYDLLAQDKPRF